MSTTAAARPHVDMPAMADYFACQPDVVVAYLFGSVARSRADHLSDVDIAVLLDENVGSEEKVERQLNFMVDLDEYANREVQVVLLNLAPPLLTYRVVQDGVLLYERNRAERLAFVVQARKVYFDLKPWLDFHTQALFDDIREVGLSERRKRRGSTLKAARRVHRRLERVPERELPRVSRE